MTVRGASNRQSRSPLKDVYVARTVEEPQPVIESFLNGLGRALGHTATIYTIGSTHLTFLESRGLQPHFERDGYGPSDISDFKDELQRHLEGKFPKEDRTVVLNSRRPLRWIGYRKLAFNIVPTVHLTAVRASVEEFLGNEFGVVPRMQSFRPHITIGEVHYDIDNTVPQNPARLLPGGLQIPRNVAMNGLSVYLGSIHPEPSAVA